MRRRSGSGTWLDSRWPELFSLALQLLDSLPQAASWSFGGGTRLALLYGHRISYDVDIFVTDAQLLPYLSPRLNDATAALVGDAYREDSAFLKLSFECGDVDVIVAPILTIPGSETIAVLGRDVPAQTPEEILAKKMQYRGAAFTHRDAFDLAMLLDRDPSRVTTASRACGAPALALLRTRLRHMLPTLDAELPHYVNPTEPGRRYLAAAAPLAAWLDAPASGSA